MERLTNLTRADARAVEQALIEKSGLNNLMNNINSISAQNPINNDAINRGNNILNRIIGIYLATISCIVRINL